jgi:hypothetical protein
MTPNEFRKLALECPGAIESEHMNHPDFRVGGKVFATLGYPSENWGMVKLTPEQQHSLIKMAPDVFWPCSGVWGDRGATNVHLASATKSMARAALEVAWKNVSAKALKKRPRPRTARKA